MSGPASPSAKSSPVIHTIPPVWNSQSRVLLLGTMPSPASRSFGFYYGHPQNRFWPVLAALFGAEVPAEADERRAFVASRRIALWDVLASCTITGAADSTIRDPVANDIPSIIAHSSIRRIFAIGKTAGALYDRLLRDRTGVEQTTLPSPSPANRGRYPLERLIEAWKPVLEALA